MMQSSSSPFHQNNNSIASTPAPASHGWERTTSSGGATNSSSGMTTCNTTTTMNWIDDITCIGTILPQKAHGMSLDQHHGTCEAFTCPTSAIGPPLLPRELIFRSRKPKRSSEDDGTTPTPWDTDADAKAELDTTNNDNRIRNNKKQRRQVNDNQAGMKKVANKPVKKKPVTKKPVTKKPVTKKPVAKKPVAKKPVTKKQAKTTTDTTGTTPAATNVSIEAQTVGAVPTAPIRLSEVHHQNPLLDDWQRAFTTFITRHSTHRYALTGIQIAKRRLNTWGRQFYNHHKSHRRGGGRITTANDDNPYENPMNILMVHLQGNVAISFETDDETKAWGAWLAEQRRRYQSRPDPPPPISLVAISSVYRCHDKNIRRGMKETYLYMNDTFRFRLLEQLGIDLTIDPSRTLICHHSQTFV